MRNVITILICLIFSSCGSDSSETTPIIPNLNLGTGTFEILGKTYKGSCVTSSYLLESGYYRQLSVEDSDEDASFSVFLFPREAAGVWDLCANEGGGIRRDVFITIGSRQFQGYYGSVTKLSKTKFTAQGVAYEFLGTGSSTTPIPFTAHGDLIDLSAGSANSETGQYPTGTGIVNFYAGSAIPDTLRVVAYKIVDGSWQNINMGTLTHARINPDCGQAEFLFFTEPGQYYYYTEVPGQSGYYTTGNFTVAANACNLVNIN